MKDTEKLFEVKLQGLLQNFDPCYVVASDPTEAYQKVRKWLDDNKYGFSSDRGLKSVTVVAENSQYTECKHRLFL